MKINIMTWNTGITENLSDIDRCKEIFRYIKKILEKENSIVFLQQMVYKDPNNNWMIHNCFKEFEKEFTEKYDILYYPDSTFMMTVAIAEKNKIKPLGKEYYPLDTQMNRAIAVEFNGVSFLGIHAQNNMDNKGYLKSLHGKSDIILGDFNAGNYLKSENREVFNSILKEHICICNMPTKIIEKGSRKGERTCIDHIFVREDMIIKCTNLVVHEEITLSDHFPITFEYNK